MELLINKYSNGEVFNELSYRHALWQQVIDEEQDEYSSLISDYKIFLKACRELVSELSVDYSSFAKIKCIDKLISMGKFSYRNNFYYIGKPKELLSVLGISVVLGSGCCRHVASFAKDLLTNGFYEFCDVFSCDITENSIEEKIDGTAYHMINLIRYNGIYFGYDITNHLVFDFISPIQLKNRDSETYLCYKPEMLLISQKLGPIDIESKLREYSRSVNLKPISNEELSDIGTQTTAKMISKKKILKEFEMDTEDVKRKIYRSLMGR